MNITHNNEATWAVFIQFISWMLLIPVGWILGDKLIAGSLGLGGAICCIPQFYLYKSVFKPQNARQAHAIIKAFYFGEGLKIILTFCLFIFVLRYILWASMLHVFIGYLVVHLSFWMAPLYFGMRKKNA